MTQDRQGATPGIRRPLRETSEIVPAAAEFLELKGKPECWFGSRGASGFAVRRYSERAAERVRAKLKKNPWRNPIPELRSWGLRPARRKRGHPDAS